MESVPGRSSRHERRRLLRKRIAVACLLGALATAKTAWWYDERACMHPPADASFYENFLLLTDLRGMNIIAEKTDTFLAASRSRTGFDKPVGSLQILVSGPRLLPQSFLMHFLCPISLVERTPVASMFSEGPYSRALGISPQNPLDKARFMEAMREYVRSHPGNSYMEAFAAGTDAIERFEPIRAVFLAVYWALLAAALWCSLGVVWNWDEYADSPGDHPRSPPVPSPHAHDGTDNPRMD